MRSLCRSQYFVSTPSDMSQSFPPTFQTRVVNKIDCNRTNCTKSSRHPPYCTSSHCDLVRLVVPFLISLTLRFTSTMVLLGKKPSSSEQMPFVPPTPSTMALVPDDILGRLPAYSFYFPAFNHRRYSTYHFIALCITKSCYLSFHYLTRISNLYTSIFYCTYCSIQPIIPLP